MEIYCSPPEGFPMLGGILHWHKDDKKKPQGTCSQGKKTPLCVRL